MKRSQQRFACRRYSWQKILLHPIKSEPRLPSGGGRGDFLIEYPEQKSNTDESNPSEEFFKNGLTDRWMNDILYYTKALIC